ncbi:Hypothetical predicted protein [Marmota monax]|uniref:Uncharacterized protein n=1 Tax=Marmota monax TaxID=9995 RepID=A0A5E4CUX8_MARMO|nr:Hypothetical predicted protein [Marmota monax]
MGVGPLRVKGPRRVCASPTLVSVPGAEGRDGASLGSPAHTPGCLQHRPPSLRCGWPRRVLGYSVGRRRRRRRLRLRAEKARRPPFRSPGWSSVGPGGLPAEAVAAPPAPSCPRAETSGIR